MIETDFQALFDTWQKAKRDDNQQLAKFTIEKIHWSVYNYAKRRFGADDETSSEFYTHFMSRIESILESYEQRSNFNFSVFFCFRMRGAYFNFLKSRKLKNVQSDDTVEWEDWLVPTDEELDEDNDQESQLSAVLHQLGRLKPEKKLILKLYFGLNLQLADFRTYLAMTNPRLAFSEMRKYQKRLTEKRNRRLEKHAQINEKIGKLFLSRLSGTEAALKKLLKDLNLNFSQTPFSYDYLGDMLDISRNKAGRLVKAGLEDLKKKMKETEG